MDGCHACQAEALAKADVHMFRTGGSKWSGITAITAISVAERGKDKTGMM